MSTVVIDMKEFSPTPYGRYVTDGPNNGESFRIKFLAPALKDPAVDKVVVKLDSVKPGYEYGSSFLEESFGGLIRVSGLPIDLVLDKLELETKYEDYKLEIRNYLKKAAK